MMPIRHFLVAQPNLFSSNFLSLTEVLYSHVRARIDHFYRLWLPETLINDQDFCLGECLSLHYDLYAFLFFLFCGAGVQIQECLHAK
jgi:hypothetical protein